jgi:hypothetical protein
MAVGLGKMFGFYAMLVIMCGWVLFRSDTVSQAIIFFNAMFRLG